MSVPAVALKLDTKSKVHAQLSEDLKKQLHALHGLDVEDKVIPTPPGTLVPHILAEFLIRHKDLALDVAIKMVLEVWKAAWQRVEAKAKSPQKGAKPKAPSGKGQVSAGQPQDYATLFVGDLPLKLPASEKKIKEFLGKITDAGGKR